MKLKKKFLSVFLTGIMILSLPIYASASKHTGLISPDIPILLAHLRPTAIVCFSDAERTQLIKEEYPIGVPVYYTLVCEEGYCAKLEIEGENTFINDDYFIADDEKFVLNPVSVLMGDADGDGFFGVNDIDLMLKIMAEYDVTIADPVAADYNRDGKVDVTDISDMLKCIAEWGNPHGGVQNNIWGYKKGDGYEAVHFKTHDELSVTENTIILNSENYAKLLSEIEGTDAEALVKEMIPAGISNEELFENYTLAFISNVHTRATIDSLCEVSVDNDVLTVKYVCVETDTDVKSPYTMNGLVLVPKKCGSAKGIIDIKDI